MGRKIVNLAGNAPDYVFKLIKENKIDCRKPNKKDGYRLQSVDMV